jgi:hypothetical protein
MDVVHNCKNARLFLRGGWTLHGNYATFCEQLFQGNLGILDSIRLWSYVFKSHVATTLEFVGVTVGLFCLLWLIVYALLHVPKEFPMIRKLLSWLNKSCYQNVSNVRKGPDNIMSASYERIPKRPLNFTCSHYLDIKVLFKAAKSLCVAECTGSCLFLMGLYFLGPNSTISMLCACVYARIPALALTELAVSGEAIYISAFMVIACTTLAEISLFGMTVAFLIVAGMQKR